MLFIFKICQTVAGISTTSQFHEFFNLIFGGFLSFDPRSLAMVSGREIKARALKAEICAEAAARRSVEAKMRERAEKIY